MSVDVKRPSGPRPKSKKAAERYRDKTVVANLPDGLDLLFKSIFDGLQKNNQKTMELAARIFGVDSKSGPIMAVNFQNTVDQRSQTLALPAGTTNGFERAVRNSTERRMQQLPAPSMQPIVIDARPVRETAGISVDDLLGGG